MQPYVIFTESTGDLTVDFVVVPGYGNISNYSRVNVDGKVAVVSRGGNVSFEQKVRKICEETVGENISSFAKHSPLGSLFPFASKA